MSTESAQSAKQKRYDRQLRLWGEHGQAAMEACNVCLLNGSATGAETLKNLVLPGIGSFTIVDGACVSAVDLGNNFFVEHKHIGDSRAAVVTQLLQELNEHVQGSYVTEDIAQVLDSRPDFLNSFSMVIATQTPLKELRQVASICSLRGIPLLVAHTYGLMGYVRLYLTEHTVVEAHPEHSFPDLRILKPFPALSEFAKTRYADLATLSSAEYAHVPYMVLLLKAVAAWLASHGGVLPETYAHKKEIREILEAWRRPGVRADQNIDEALGAVNKCLKQPSPPRATAQLLVQARARVSALAAELHACNGSGEGEETNASGGVRKQLLGFWLSCAALNAFVGAEGIGLLPTVGTVPDMTADTQSYVELQSIYQQQANADLAAVQAHVQSIAALESIPTDLIPTEKALRLFCKNAHDLSVHLYRSLSDEYAPAPGEPPSERGGGGRVSLTAALADESGGGALYLLLRAAHAYRAERTRWPGHADADVEADMPVLKTLVGEVLRELWLPTLGTESCPVKDDTIREFCRWGGSEMHAIAAIVGGVCSQEAIKVVTHQYVPLNNTFVFNGASGRTLTAEL